MARLKPTPSQTVGPYFSMRLAVPGENQLTSPQDPASFRIVGAVYDGDGKPMEDALLELWQANVEGHYAHSADPRRDTARDSAFTGFGRATVDPRTLEYSFETVKPGRVPAPDGALQAPHLCMVLQARGMLRPAFTRMYFDDEAAANADDFVLSRVPPERRHTLIGRRVAAEGKPVYRFDVRFQGVEESVFFEF